MTVPSHPVLAILVAAAGLLNCVVPAAVAGEDDFFGVWKRTCADGACQVFVALEHKDEGGLAVAWSMVHDPGTDRDSVFIRVPLQVAIPPGLRIYVADAASFDMPYQFCAAEGCTAIAVLTDEMKNAISGAESVRIAYVPYGQRDPVAYKVPVDGFAEALASISE